MDYCKQLLAGVLIGIGGMVYLNTMGEFWAPFLFSIGLVSVVVLGAQLYTGRIGYFPFKRQGLGGAAARYAVMLALNLLGAGLAGAAARLFYTVDAAALAAGKAAQSPLQALLLAVGCGMMMYTAVEGYKRTKSPVLIIFPVGAFILCKFDHCIADAFYFAYAGVMPPLYYLPLVVLGNSLGALALRLVFEEK